MPTCGAEESKIRPFKLHAVDEHATGRRDFIQWPSRATLSVASLLLSIIRGFPGKWNKMHALIVEQLGKKETIDFGRR